jgi:hypothetical protein
MMRMARREESPDASQKTQNDLPSGPYELWIDRIPDTTVRGSKRPPRYAIRSRLLEFESFGSSWAC